MVSDVTTTTRFGYDGMKVWADPEGINNLVTCGGNIWTIRTAGSHTGEPRVGQRRGTYWTGTGSIRMGDG